MKKIKEWLAEMPQDKQEVYINGFSDKVGDIIPDEIKEEFIDAFLESEEDSMMSAITCHTSFNEESFNYWQDYMKEYYGEEEYQARARQALMDLMLSVLNSDLK